MNGNSTLSKFYNIPRKSAHYFDTSTKEKVWKTDFFDGKKFIYYGWPYFVKNGKAKLDPISRADTYKADKLIKNINDETEIYVIHLVDLDKALHEYGTSSLSTKLVLQKQDYLVKTLFEAFTNKFDDFNIVIWSDHGFLDVHTFVETHMNSEKDYISFYDSTLARFWFDKEEEKKKLESELKKLKYGVLLNDALKKKYKVPNDRKYGDLIFALNPGYVFMPNCYQSSEVKGMHGYCPDKCDIDGILLTDLKLNKKVLNFKEANRLITYRSN